MSPAPDPDALELARRAIAYYEALKVFFPAYADDSFALARTYLGRHGLRYWIGPDGKSITCITCGMTSANPHDIEQRYCGHCHVFHDDEARKESIDQPPGPR